MTDVLDEELLSPNERPPSGPPARPALREAQQLSSVTCEYCGESFSGPMHGARLGRHVKAKHPEHWTAKPSKGKKAPAKKAPSPVKKAAAKAPAPGTVVRRKPAADALCRMAMRFGKFAQAVEPPFGNALVFSAPAMGVAADEAVAGTMIDRRVVQPLAKMSDRWDALSSAFGLPFMVLVVSKNPKLYFHFEEELREAVEDVLIAQVPIIERKAAKRKKVIEALDRLGQLDPEIANSSDPIGDILRGFFPPPAVDPEPGPPDADEAE